MEESKDKELKRIKKWIEECRKQIGESDENTETPKNTESINTPSVKKTEEPVDELAKFMPKSFNDWPVYIQLCWRREMELMKRYSRDDKQGLNIKRYLEWFEKIPWNRTDVKEIDIGYAKEVLDKEHFGMEDVKQIIIEILAVQKLKRRHVSPVLLLTGPPGVGKTSLAKSIARALSRPFAKISLGGMTDELSLKGSDRAYMNSFPGAIIRELCNSGSSALLILFDEIDKIPAESTKGDCASILLDILDTNRTSFIDNFLQVPFDLSDAFFICTANDETKIPKPLLDRMEVIRLCGYTYEEKYQIAKRHIIPRMLDESGLNQYNFEFSDDAVETLVDACKAKEGVRELERLVAAVCRRVALLFLEDSMEGKIITEDFIISQNILKNFLPVKERRIGFYNGEI